MIEAIQPDDAIQPLMAMTNRWQKRKYQQEALRVVHHLEEINTSFLYEIFNEDTVESYGSLYQEYSQKWIDRVKAICKNQKIRFIGIDLQWFERNYRPRHND
jgi:hypothetical protein